MQTTLAQPVAGQSRRASSARTAHTPTCGEQERSAFDPQKAGGGSSKPKVSIMLPQESRSLIEALANSKVYQEYERAFSDATGLLVSLRPVESWRLAHHGKRNESPFCDMMSEKSRSCAACLQVQERLADAAVVGAHTMTCFAGLSDTAVPVRLGDQVVGFLQTGQVFRKPPTRAQFERA